MDELQILDGLGEEWYTKVTLQYLEIAGNIPDKEGFVKAVEGKLSEKTAMNLLHEFEKDGFKKGKLEVALSLFADGLSLEKVAQLTGLSIDDI